jgi:hypothetical protein
LQNVTQSNKLKYKNIIIIILRHMHTNTNSVPQTLLDCVDDAGELDYLRVLQYHKMLRARGKKFLYEQQLADDVLESSSSVAPTKRKRAPRGVMQYYDPDLDDVVNFPPSESPWWICYISQPAISGTNFFPKFRNKFRLPYNLFSELVDKVVKSESSFPNRFRKFGGPNRKHHRETVPIELLVLGTLTVLGRATIFDSLADSTYISGETHRVFFHAFTEWGSRALYAEFVFYPRTQQEVQVHLNEMDASGMPGNCSSTDATHVSIEKCQARLSNAHTGK